MKQHAFLVQTSDGAIVRKVPEAMAPEDEFVFDGPDAFAGSDALQKWLDAQIEEAGGVERWRERVAREGLPEMPPHLRHLVR